MDQNPIWLFTIIYFRLAICHLFDLFKLKLLMQRITQKKKISHRQDSSSIKCFAADSSSLATNMKLIALKCLHINSELNQVN